MAGRKASRIYPADWRARGARPGGDRGRRILRADSDRDSLRRSDRADSALEPFYRRTFWKAARAAPGLRNACGSLNCPRRSPKPEWNTRWSTTAIFLRRGARFRNCSAITLPKNRGRTVKVIPGLQELRYLLPFGSVDDSVAFLRRSAQRSSGRNGLHGRRHGKIWRLAAHLGTLLPRRLARPFLQRHGSQSRLAGNGPAGRSPGGAHAARPRGPAHGVVHGDDGMGFAYSGAPEISRAAENFRRRPDVRRFLRGGFWRGFFSKYAESNLLHKKMLRVSSKLRQRRAGKAREKAPRERCCAPRQSRTCCGRNATTPTGTEFSAGSTRRI